MYSQLTTNNKQSEIGSKMDKALFAGGESFDGKEIEKGVLRNLTSDVAEKLKAFGWLGRPAGCICLSPDIKNVRAGVLAVRGRMEDKELRVDSSKIWPAASADTFLSIRLPRLTSSASMMAACAPTMSLVQRSSTRSTQTRRAGPLHRCWN